MRMGKLITAGLMVLLLLPAAAESQERVEVLAGRDPAGESLLSRPARLVVRDLPLSDALTRLYWSSGVPLAFSPSVLPDRFSTCECRSVTVADALDLLLRGTALRYREVEGSVVIIPRPADLAPVPAPASLVHHVEPVSASRASGSIAPPPRSQDLSIGGRVIDGRTLEALAGAQILLVGTGRGALTDADGRFRIDGIQSDAVTIRVVMLGYRSLEQEVRAGEMGLRLSLDASAITLDRIVVTGTVGELRQRAIGNAVSSVNVSSLMEVAPSPDLSQLLNNRAPGVVINPGGGEVGAGGHVRIRGVSSLSLNNAPLVYVDGVRIEGEDAANRFLYTGGLWNVSRLNDLDPAEIENIEILKGPAAATLYGTEASNGVINIITKRGVSGRTRIGMTVDQGANWISDPVGTFPFAYYRDDAGVMQRFSTVQSETERGTPIFRTGHRQRYAVDASGGIDRFRYFISGGFEQNESPFRINDMQRFSGRMNLESELSDKLTVKAGAGYVQSLIHPGGNANGTPLTCVFYPDRTLLDTPSRGCAGGPPEAYSQAWDRTQDVNRFTGDITVTFEPWEWLTNRLIVGTDVVDQENTAIVERLPADIAPYFGATADGLKETQRARSIHRTFDYSASANTQPFAPLSSSTSVGLQIYQTVSSQLHGSARQFPTLGIRSLSSAASITASEVYVENATVGTFVQQQLGWKDRLFLTGAIRADDNSAFGSDFDLVVYPKLSGAWVVNEEPFWPLDFVSTFRLRAAYGQAGRQPDAFSALQTYEPFIGPGDVATVRPQFLGNPELGPERGEEIELGFEAALFGDRVSVDFTWYDTRTTDAIVLRNTAPSLGFPQAQYVNIGEIQNGGIELALNGAVIRADNVHWDLGLSFATNTNEIVSLGDLPTIPYLIRQQFREGHPVGGWFERKVVQAEVTPDGLGVTNILCDGGPEANHAPVPCAGAPRIYLGDDTPDRSGNFNSTLTLGDRLTLYGQLDFKTRYHILNFARVGACIFRRQCQENVDPSHNPIWAAEEQLGIWGHSVFQDASFLKLRQLSATYRLPDRWAGYLGAASGSITLSGRNLHTWSHWWTRDPEVQDILTGSGLSLQNLQQGDLPNPTQFLTSVRLTF